MSINNDKLEHLETRVSRIEKEMDKLRDMISAEQIVIEQLRSVVAEHSKQFEKIAHAIEKQSEDITKLYSSVEVLKTEYDMVYKELDKSIDTLKSYRGVVSELISHMRDMMKYEKANWKLVMGVIRDVVVYAFIIVGGLKMYGVI